MDGTIVEPV